MQVSAAGKRWPSRPAAEVVAPLHQPHLVALLGASARPLLLDLLLEALGSRSGEEAAAPRCDGALDAQGRSGGHNHGGCGARYESHAGRDQGGGPERAHRSAHHGCEREGGAG